MELLATIQMVSNPLTWISLGVMGIVVGLQMYYVGGCGPGTTARYWDFIYDADMDATFAFPVCHSSWGPLDSTSVRG